MLPKYLMILCSACLLTACGGSSGSSNTDSSVGNSSSTTGNASSMAQSSSFSSGDSSSSVPGHQPAVWLDMRFDQEEDVETWAFGCQGDCNATAAFDWNESEGVLDITAAWADAADELEAWTTIDPEIADMSGGYAHLSLYVPEAYTSAATVRIQMLFRNASDGTGYIGWLAAQPGWNHIYLEDIVAGSGDNDYGSFGWHSGTFTLETINRVGFQIKAEGENDGFVGVTETLHVDNVILSPEPIDLDSGEEPGVTLETGDISYTFAEGVEGWNNDSATASTLSHDGEQQALVITPNWADSNEGGNRPKAMVVAPQVISEARIQMLVTVTQGQIDAGIGLQMYIQQNSGSYTQAFGPLIAAADLNAGDNVLSWDTPELADAQRVGVQLLGNAAITNTDPVLLKQVEITLPESETDDVGLVVDFEADEPGETYGSIGWNVEDLVAEVVTVASVTAGDGLPTKGDSVNVLKVIANNYNTVPKFNITLPEGKTLADYNVVVDAYFPTNTVGLDDDGDNGFKPFMLFAGENITGIAESSGDNANPAYQSTYNTGADDRDVWMSFELSVDAESGAELTGNIQIALGISRNASSGPNDAYYFDSIRLVEIEQD